MTAPDWSFRRATRGDVADIVALVQRAYRGEAGERGWTTEAHLLDGQRTDPEEVAQLVEADDARIVLALQGTTLCGSVLLEVQTDAVIVGMFAVEPALQANGLGRAMLAEVERVVRSELLASALRMTVIGQRAELIGWYVRRGYLCTGQRKPFPYGQGRFGLPRRDDLYFEVLEKPLVTR